MDVTVSAISDVVEAFRAVFGRLATTEGTAARHGVAYRVPDKTRDTVEFVFRTPDKLLINVPVELNRMSRQYVEDVIAATHERINEARAERQKERRIWLPGGV